MCLTQIYLYLSIVGWRDQSTSSCPSDGTVRIHLLLSVGWVGYNLQQPLILTCLFEVMAMICAAINISSLIQYLLFVLVKNQNFNRSFTVPTVTKFVSFSNPAHGEVYSIQHYVIKFVSDLRQIGGFPRVLRFAPEIKLTTTIYQTFCWKWR